jgi:hypothetical protein
MRWTFTFSVHVFLGSQRVGSCYLEVSLGTTGVDTWCYLECYLVLHGVTWAGVAWHYLAF